MRTYLYPRKTYAVSVIIPMYNAEKYVGECLESLLAQTFQDFEVIVVDDYSKDNSAKVIESYAPKFNGRLTLTVMERNTGSGALPRNKGLSLSQGEYVFFMDSDDFLKKSGLEEMYALAKKYVADVVYCEKYSTSTGTGQEFIDNIENICPNVGKMQRPPFVDEPTFETENLAERVNGILGRRFWVAPWGFFVHRNLLLENKIFFPHVKIAEDTIWTYGIIFYAKRFLRIPNIVYIRRFSEDSMTGTTRYSSQQINFCLNPVLLGLRSLDNLISRHEFFQSNSSCRHAVLKKLVNDMFAWSLNSAKNLTEDFIYLAIKKEFGKKLGDYDVLISMLCAALYKEKIAVNKINPEIFSKCIARIDSKLVPKTGKAIFNVISMSDAKADTNRMSWLKDTECGYFVQSYAGKLDFIAKVVTDGRFSLNLRGICIPTPEDKNKRIPYWIDYTKLTVNGKVIFDKVIPAWHDKPYHYNLDVKAGEEINIQTEWLPHRDERFNVPTLAPTIQTEPTIDKKFLPYLTSRLDVIMMSEGDLQIVSTSDNKAKVAKAHWLPKNESGCFVQSCVGKMEVVAKASADSQIQLLLKGMDIRNPDDKSKRIPYWIDYTKFTVNGEVIFDKLTPVWHDKPYSYTLDVKADEEIKVQTEWQPHRDDRFDVSDAVAKTQETLKKNDQAIQESKNHSTARIDVILEPTEQGDFQILSVSDDKALIRKAHWLAANKIGYFVHSYAGKMEIIIKVIGGGQFNLELRGIDIRDPEDKSKRIPYWIDYTKLNVNGEVIFDELTPVWHDKSFSYNIDAKDGEEIIISVEWQPHRSDT